MRDGRTSALRISTGRLGWQGRDTEFIRSTVGRLLDMEALTKKEMPDLHLWALSGKWLELRIRERVRVPWLRKQVVDKLAEIVGARIKNILDVESFSILKELDRCRQLLN